MVYQLMPLPRSQGRQSQGTSTTSSPKGQSVSLRLPKSSCIAPYTSMRLDHSSMATTNRRTSRALQWRSSITLSRTTLGTSSFQIKVSSTPPLEANRTIPVDFTSMERSTRSSMPRRWASASYMCLIAPYPGRPQSMWVWWWRVASTQSAATLCVITTQLLISYSLHAARYWGLTYGRQEQRRPLRVLTWILLTTKRSRRSKSRRSRMRSTISYWLPNQSVRASWIRQKPKKSTGLGCIRVVQYLEIISGL